MRQNRPGEDRMYQALLEKDSRFEGVFIVGVKTTGIFCRPSCTARKPKRENVLFFNTAKEALLDGYRPCKVCKPMEPLGKTPDYIESLIQELRTEPDLRLRDADLRNRGLEPDKVRRWFKKNHNMTFQAYQRSLKINQAFGSIRYGDSVTQTAFSQGYESISGFQDAFKRVGGVSPSKANGKTVVSITRLSTPLGPMLAGATEEGICLLEFTDRRMLETQIKRLEKYLKAVFLPGDNPHFETLNQQLQAYFARESRSFDLPLLIPGTPFQKKVWAALLNIPYGETRSYKQQAEALGNPKAIRAVGTANGDNRLAIIVPCHRVLGADGGLRGYGGGIWRKEWLLKHESAAGVF